ncbi:MAG: ice-binding family protein [Anaerolineales bacterium]
MVAIRRTRRVPASIYARSALIVVLVLGLALMSGIAQAAPPGYANPAAVNLLTVDNFTALAASLISSPSGPTTLNDGDMGIASPGTCTNFAQPPCDPSPITGTINNGVIQYQNGPALLGQTHSTAVVGNLNGRTVDQAIVAGGLTGLTLNRGVYDVTSVGGGGDDLTGDLTLNGNADAIFIFRFNDTFITSGTARVLLTGAVQACNVYWTSASGVTFAGTTEMVGTVFAQSSVTFPGGGAVLDGRVIAQTAAINFNNTTINNVECLAPTPTPTNTPLPTNTPTPGLNPTQIARLTATAQSLQAGLPVTGFAQGVDTILAEQPEELAYSSLGDLWLEIPDLDVETSILGVPQVDGEWDVSWLGSDAGWLYGTAFPTWAGNSALTGHVYDANGDPGPFARLSSLQFGDQVIVHAWGLAYTFEIRSVGTVYATTRVSSVIKHEAFPWLTLITCSGYDEASDSYKYRVIARAVLVSIDYE